MGWRDIQFNEEHTQEQELQFIQWTRGTGLAEHPKNSHFGFWEFNHDNWAHVLKGGPFDEITVTGFNGDERTGFYTPTINFAMLSMVVLWEFKAPGASMPTYHMDYVPGGRRRARVMGYVKELLDMSQPGLVYLTIGGMNVKYFLNSYKQYKQKICDAAAASAGQNLPPYVFWTPLGPGEQKVTVGKKEKNYITPPLCLIEGQTPDSLYVGDEVIELCVSQWERAQEWKMQQEAFAQMSGEQQVMSAAGSENGPVETGVTDI